MAKKEKAKLESKPADEFYKMSEREATRQYLKTLNQIRKEKGTLAALGYELKSTFYSLGKRIGNLFETRSDAEKWYADQHRMYVESGGNESFKPSERDRERAGYETRDREYRKNTRTAGRKEYILRGRGLEHTASTGAVTAIITALGIGTGLFFIFGSFPNSSVHMSPGTSPANWRLWAGIIILLIGIIGAIFLIKHKK